VNVRAASTGIKKAVDAAWESLPQILISAIVAGFVFLGGLWVGHRELVSVVDGVIADQQLDRLCPRIGECQLCRNLDATRQRLEVSSAKMEHHIELHDKESESWKQRIILLEQRVYDMMRKAP